MKTEIFIVGLRWDKYKVSPVSTIHVVTAKWTLTYTISVASVAIRTWAAGDHYIPILYFKFYISLTLITDRVG